MKNRPKYLRTYHQVGQTIRIRKREVKLSRLYCFACHTYEDLIRFPKESGYGSKARYSVCDTCLTRHGGMMDVSEYY